MYLGTSFIVWNVIGDYIQAALSVTSCGNTGLLHSSSLIGRNDEPSKFNQRSKCRDAIDRVPTCCPLAHGKWSIFGYVAGQVFAQQARLYFDASAIGDFVFKDWMGNHFLHTLLKFFQEEPFGGLGHAIAIQFQDKVALGKLAIIQQAEHHRIDDDRP